jgi:hypothetical protein
MTIKQDIVNLVIQRAGGYCESCGRPASESMALHHRKLKSRGGKDAVSNLMWVHHECHNLGTNSIHLKPAYATFKGWMVSSWADPEAAPMHLPDGRIVLLQNDGKITELKEG